MSVLKYGSIFINHREIYESVRLVKKQKKYIKDKIGNDPMSIVIDYLYPKEDESRDKLKEFQIYTIYKEYERVKKQSIDGIIYCRMNQYDDDDIDDMDDKKKLELELNFKFNEKHNCHYIEKEKLTSEIYSESLIVIHRERKTKWGVRCANYRLVKYLSKSDRTWQLMNFMSYVNTI